MKVLIVDDEQRSRNGIASLIQKNDDGWHVVGQAESGERALQIIQNELPDLLITDICMPGIDGLELIEQVKTQFPQTEIVIISGYSEFEYAKKAIKLGVIDFILKPIDEEEFLKLLEKISLKIKNSQSTINPGEKEKYIRAISFSGLLFGNPLDETICRQLALTRSGYLTVVFEWTENQEEQLQLQQKLVADFLSSWDLDYFSLIFYEHLIVVMSSSMQTVKNLNNHLKINGKGLWAIGVSSEWSTPEQATRSFEQAFSAVKEGLYYGAGFYQFQDKPEDLPFRISSNWAHQLKSAVNKSDYETGEMLIQQLSFQISQLRPDYFALESALQKILIDILEQAEQNQAEISSQYRPWLKPYFFGRCLRQEELLRLIKQFIRDSIDAVQKASGMQSQRKVQEVVSFIHENFEKDLSLDMVAEKVNLSSRYLSNYFKVETGSNFVEYITKVRLERAKVLLVSTYDKVQDIARHVGYQDVKYFNRIFKKNVGVTPQEYREFSK